MDISLSTRVRSVKPSPTLAITARANEMRAAGEDVIALSAGEPDFPTPEPIRAAGIAAIERGDTHYTAVDGTAELKQAIIHKLKRDNGLDYGPGQIIVSCGAKQSLYNLIHALIGEGDEVVIPAPYWVSYPDMVTLASGTSQVIEAGADQGFRILPGQLDAALNERSKLLLLNSPSNPAGVPYSRRELEALGEVLQRHPQVIVASDDIYEHTLWGEERFVNIANACPKLIERIVVINGVSKAYAMTGWRIGYAAGPQPLIAGMRKIQSQCTSGPCSISQAAATAALESDPALIQPMVDAFHERHDFVVERLNAIRGIRCPRAEGTFYCFPQVSEAIEALGGVDDDVAFAEYLLNNAGVAVVPGSAFGLPGHVRLSFATGMDNLRNAMDRIEQALGRG